MCAANKNRYFQLRLSEAELSALDAQARSRDMTKSAYVTYLIVREERAAAPEASADDAPQQETTPVLVYHDADFKTLIWHLSRWGNNLNQASTALNKLATGVLEDTVVRAELLRAADAIVECDKAISSIERIVERLRDERHVVMGE